MANQFEIPGLEESIKNVKILGTEVEKLTKDLLKVAIDGEKAMAPFKNTSTLKGFTEAQRESAIRSKEVTKANDELTAKLTKLSIAQGDVGKKIAAAAVETQKINLLNKESAKLNGENSTALEKMNAQISKSTRESKELGAQMVLLRQAGKGTSDEYKEVEKAFKQASAESKKLNDDYRAISKSAGDNRALVGSYADELKGSFDSVNQGVNGVKEAIERGDLGGAFSSGRTAVMGFAEAVKRTQTQAKDTGAEMSKTGTTIGDLKAKVTDTTKDLKNFFKPSEENSEKMAQGLERVKIGFTQNNAAVNTYKKSLSDHTAVSKSSNAETEKGGLISTVFARAQIALSGATGIASGAMNILKVAIASTGIGLIIIAVGLLVAGLMKLDPVMDKIEQLFAGFSGGLNKAIDIVTTFVTSITSLQDGFSKLGDIILNPIESLKKLGKAIGDSAVAMAKLKEAEQDLEDNTKVFDLRNKRLESEINLDKIRLRSKGLTAKQLADIEKDIETKERQISANKNSLATEEIRIALETAGQREKINKKSLENEIKNGELVYATFLLNAGKIDQAIFDQLQKAANNKVEINNRLAESEESNQAKIEKAQNRINAQRDKEQAAAEKARDKAIADREKAQQKAESDAKKSLELVINAKKSVLDATIAGYKQEQNAFDENLAFVKSVSLQKQEIANLDQQKNLVGVAKGSLDYKNIVAKTKSDIEKIKSEESTAIENITKKNIQFELEIYDYRNQTLIEDGKDLTDILVSQEKERLLEFQRIHLEALAKELSIDDELLKAKIKNNEKLSENDLKYLKGKQALEKQTAAAIKKNDADLLKVKEKAILNEEKENNTSAKQKEKTALKLAKEELKNEQKKLLDLRKLYENDAEKIKEIDNQLAENKMKVENIQQNAIMKGRDDALNNLVTIAGKESDLGKAAALAQIAITTQKAAMEAYANGMEFGGPAAPFLATLYASLAVAAGLKSASEVAGISFFAEGTDDAPYTGKAIVDELGPEFHFDKNWNLKSEGSETGARFTDIVKGDKIIPADISALLKYSMYTGGNVLGANPIDYDKIGEQFKKHTDIQTNRLAKELRLNRSAVSINVQPNIKDRVTFRGKNV